MRQHTPGLWNMRPTDIYDMACPCLDVYKDLLCFFQDTTADILVEYENLFVFQDLSTHTIPSYI